MTATLASLEYSDRVFGCWLGKNCGGTLGQPLEEAFGRSEPFDVWWYPEIAEGGIPNDDLEMQLIWLKAVIEQWPNMNARKLAEYWLDHIGYNYDEYGFSKANLRLGLLPPVSGRHNNWFIDCMGSPIRSEIWACLSPGVPALAARRAYEDAICDHAGGEGVYGELFNASIESAAFVLHDMDDLLDVALTYIPEDCGVARAVRAARGAHRSGRSWTEARSHVLEATPHYVAQYTPINMGFQVIGWLYGENFGDAICKAVNCGYDTDCTGATVGSLLGILRGRAGLPERWTLPLGHNIATSEASGGIKYVTGGTDPVPPTLDRLTELVCDFGERLLVVEDSPLRIGTSTSLEELQIKQLVAPPDIRDLWHSEIMRVNHQLPAAAISVDYGESPVVRLDAEKRVGIEVVNGHPEPIELTLTVFPPPGWTSAGESSLRLAPGETGRREVTLHVSEADSLLNSNRTTVGVWLRGRPSEVALSMVLVGAHRWRVVGPYRNEDDESESLLERPFEPEQQLTEPGWTAAAPSWSTVQCDGDALSPGLGIDRPGAWYGVTYLKSARQETVHLGVPSTGPLKAWLNGELVLCYDEIVPYRPSYQGHSQPGYAEVELRQGWNELMLKVVKPAGSNAWEGQCMLSRPPMFDGIHDVGWTQFPWEEAADRMRTIP